jgi:SAM-dependent methyltransferase
MNPLDEYRRVWTAKPALRTVYHDFFRRISEASGPGPTLEIGSGISNLREQMPKAIASDIQFSPNLDVVADAQRLPFPDGFLGNIVMLDVLHHIEYPLLFLRGAAKSLRKGGRMVMVEPAITLGSTFFYRFLDQEPVRMSADPLITGEPDPNRDPYSSNQAIPTLIATRDRKRFETLVPELDLKRVEWFAFAAYPLCGGFKRWSLISDSTAKALLVLERKLEKSLGSTFGFRMMLVMQKL